MNTSIGKAFNGSGRFASRPGKRLADRPSRVCPARATDKLRHLRPIPGNFMAATAMRDRIAPARLLFLA
jgi:hypothetical protein